MQKTHVELRKGLKRQTDEKKNRKMLKGKNRFISGPRHFFSSVKKRYK